jgi:hypothetical protein
MSKSRSTSKDPRSRRKAEGGKNKVPQSMPLELAGRWVAWSSDGLRIIGSGTTLEEAVAVAAAAGEEDPIFERAMGGLRR